MKPRKPRIWLQNGVWRCAWSHAAELDEMGRGMTPRGAWMAWMLDVRCIEAVRESRSFPYAGHWIRAESIWPYGRVN